MKNKVVSRIIIGMLLIAMISFVPMLSLPASAATLDAEFISCTLPETVLTDEVFEAKIVIKNTSDAPWGHNTGQIPVTLVSKNPDFCGTWGTYFIIQGQHDTVDPGETFTFSSWLRAPNTPGIYDFSWQCLNAIPVGGAPLDRTRPFFGDQVTDQIQVVQRQDAEPPVATPQEGMLNASDFEYAGSFIPPGLNGHESVYTDSSLTLRHVNNEKHLLLRTGTYNYRLYEIKIPELIKISGNSYAAVKTAPVVRDWGELEYGVINGETIGANSGMWLDESANLLYWTHYNYYFCGGPGDFPMLMATRLNDDGTKTHMGYWYIPNTPQKFKSYWGGITKLSQQFADTYTGGRDLAMGFGGVYCICGPASRGPALGAVARPGTTGSTLDLVEMMTYPDPEAAVRDGNYFSNVGYWSTQPESPWKGSWTASDACPTGVFIDLPDKKGYLAFARQATGRIGYDYGGYNSDGHYQNVWYFYDIDDLGAAAKGDLSPTSLVPSSYTTVQYPLEARGTYITGSCFDEAERMLYVYAKQSIPGTYGYKPIIHAYRVTGEAAILPPPPPPVNHAPVLSVIGPKACDEGIVLSFAVSAVDEDSGNNLTYSAVSSPSGALPQGTSFNAATGIFSWTPSLTQSGVYTIRFSVSDGTASDYEDVIITVRDVPAKTSGAITADHRYATLESLLSIPQSAITKAKTDLKIVYGHTSHGSQITDGMSGLVTFMNTRFQSNNLYAWNNGGKSGALDLRDTPSGFGTDLGNSAWVANTRTYLNAHPEINVVMWSWCGQVSGATDKTINDYLSAMSQLERDYPKVKFVYMTGHVDGSGEAGNLHVRNNQIRTYCRENNKILFDFADIESYDPDGNYYLNRAVDDACNYDSDGNGSRDKNWATLWQNSHVQNQDWYSCGSAHSQPLNANRKAYAAWYLWARLAGWDGTGGGGEVPQNHAPVLSPIGSKTVNEGSELRFSINATDSDSGAVLIYTTGTLPEGANFNTSTRTFSWIPSHSQSGSYMVRFIVSDGSLTDSEEITITVKDVQIPPTNDGGGGSSGGSGGGSGGSGGGSGGSGDSGGSGGGSNGSTGSGGGYLPPPAPSPIATVNGSQIAIDPVVTGGTAISAMTVSNCLDAFSQSIPDSEGVSTITLNVAKTEGAKDYIQQIPASILSGGTDKQQISIKTALATVTIQGNMFTSGETDKKQNMGISVGVADTSKLSQTLRISIGARPVIELQALADNKPFVWNNQDTPVIIEIPYTPTAEELKNPDHIVVWYIDGKGKVIEVPNGKYNPVTGKVVFSTTHFSTYAVSYVHKTYDDLEDTYARSFIEALASKGFYKWLDGNQFKPDRPITRAEFIYLLVTALNLRADFRSNFVDVQTSDYYYEAVGIAKSLGITNGVGGNRLGAAMSITRQDMATILVKALQAARKNYPNGSGEDLKSFSDANKINAYARESLATLVKAGVLNGYDHLLSPNGDFTMQQAAVVIYKVYKK